MQFLPLSTGLGWQANGSGIWSRRLDHLAFHAGRLCDRVGQSLGRAFRAWAAQRLAREMQTWPEERLRDIGLTRGALVAAVEGVKRPFQWVPAHDAAKMDPARFGH